MPYRYNVYTSPIPEDSVCVDEPLIADHSLLDVPADEDE